MLDFGKSVQKGYNKGIYNPTYFSRETVPDKNTKVSKCQSLKLLNWVGIVYCDIVKSVFRKEFKGYDESYVVIKNLKFTIFLE